MAVKVDVTGVDGLRDLARDLKSIDDKLPKQLQKANKAFGETVASKARGNYRQSRSGRGAASIRALATQKSVSVAFGSAAAPYMVGQEFGSGQGLNKKQFPPYNAGQGNFFYPAVREEAKDIPEKYADALQDFLRSVGFN